LITFCREAELKTCPLFEDPGKKHMSGKKPF